MPESSEIARQIRHGIFVLITAALVVLFVWCAWRLLLLAFAGLLFGIILRAFLDFVEARTHFGPRLSMLIVILALCAALGLTVWLIAPRVIAQGGEIVSYVPKSLHQAASYFNQFDWGRNIVSLVKRSLGQLNIGSKITSITFNLVDSAVGVIVVFVVGFYGALEPRTYERGLLLLIPTGRRDRAEAVLKEVIHTLRWWVLGQLIPMTVLGAATMISLWVLGVPLAFTLGLLTGVMIFVPYIGALLSEIPAAPRPGHDGLCHHSLSGDPWIGRIHTHSSGPKAGRAPSPGAHDTCSTIHVDRCRLSWRGARYSPGGCWIGARQNALFERAHRALIYLHGRQSARYFLSNSYKTTAPALATFRECFIPSIGMRTCVSARSSSGLESPSTSCPNSTQRGNRGRQSKISTACTLVSIAAISWPARRSCAMATAGSLRALQRTRSSAPSAVFFTPLWGGRAVMPLKYKCSMPAPSAVRKNAPTLYMLRTLSSRMLTGRCSPS